MALRLLATWFDIKWIKMEAIETMVACSAMAVLQDEESKEETQSQQSSWSKWKRGGIIGAAALTGGTLMAITGGLAAPAIAAGFIKMFYLMFRQNPAAGAGLTGTKMARRMGDVDEFEFKAIGEHHNQGRLAVEILISGFVCEEEDFVKPWEGINGNLERSDEPGKLLAEVLLKGLQGNRPVTLVGFSLGARVIFKCLQSLAEKDNSAGLVEQVFLLGAPLAIKDVNWEAARKVVAGRFVNAYATNDWMLGIAFRASLLTQGLAGIQPVDVPGIENVDVTELIDGHSYLWATPQILEQLKLDAPCPVLNLAVVKT